MLEDYDPNFANLINDIGYCIALVFQTLKIFFGLSYLVGSKIVESLAWILSTTITGYQEVIAVGSIIANEFTEFVTSFGRAILLIYYGATKITESFYIAAVDIQYFYHHFTGSIQRTVTNTGNYCYECLTGIFTEVPQQIVSALSMVGESAMRVETYFINILQDFIYRLFWSPIEVLLLLSKVVVYLALLPVNFLRNMPPASILGLFVVIIGAYVFRRLLRYLILQNLIYMISGLWAVVVRILFFVRLTHLTNIVTYSVSTIAQLRDSTYSGSCKAVCVICQDKPVSFMSNPCRHVCLCDGCVRALVEHDSRCPMCRSQVTKYEQVFIP